MDQLDLARKTIADFGEQWTTYVGNEGRYGSTEYFFDIVSPLLKPEDVRGASVADVGSGTGRTAMMLLEAGAKLVHAIEPSGAFDVLKANTADRSERIVYHQIRGDELPATLGVDLVVAIGVIHHIPDPASTMRAMFHALRTGGRCVVWLYAREGNEPYLAVANPARWVTTRLPHSALAILSHMLNLAASAYAWAARWLPLPMAGYMSNVFARMTRRTRYLTIYDQLNPAYSKYYRKEEARTLLSDAGFVDVQLNHRHGYSWTVTGRKP
jgi:SAM-dependent methyltransferase